VDGAGLASRAELMGSGGEGVAVRERECVCVVRQCFPDWRRVL
jgi:hypothetical protein